MKHSQVNCPVVVRLRRWSLLLIGALLLSSCTTSVAPTSPGVVYPEASETVPVADATLGYSVPSQPAVSESSQIEEVVVTGMRRSSRRERSLALRKKPKPPIVKMRSEPSVLMPGEELWIIAKSTPATSGSDSRADDGPGSGAMLARLNDGARRQVPLPLQHTAVTAQTNGYVSTVNVRQSFANPFASKIEALYLFPLPEKAAVTEFLMVIGERKIRGILRDKVEAEAIYHRAKAQGYQASLLVQRRPNVFEQKVANIEPGKSIDVDIKYFHTLAYRDGWYEFVFPTVVGPRFNPPGTQDPLVAVGRGSGNPTGKAVYLRPNERSAHDLSINLTIDAGVAVEALNSTHKIKTFREDDRVAVSLADQATLPNRDFIVRFKVTGKQLKSNLLTYADPIRGEGYFTMMVYPPNASRPVARQPMEMVFVVDGSGSMAGKPLQQAKQAIAAVLEQLNSRDTFQIIRFSDKASALGSKPLVATRRNKQRAAKYLRRLNGSGGTHMMAGVEAALGFPADPERLRFVSFMTDGYIGNEPDILAGVARSIGDARVFSFGVGSSVNRFLLERMAVVGRGAAAFLGPTDSGGEIMADFFARISRPVLTDVRVDFGNMRVSDVYPRKLPDLFHGRPIVVTGKFTGSADRVTIAGSAGGQEQWFDVPVAGSRTQSSYLPQLWARVKIADLSNRLAVTGDPYQHLSADIKQTALAYQLMSAYTSFVAVDASRVTQGSYGVTVPQALQIPDGVRYDTSVSEP